MKTLILIAVAMSVCGSVMAKPVTILSDKVTYIRQSYSTQNYSDADIVNVWGHQDKHYTDSALVEWDLSKLAGKSIVKATIKLKARDDISGYADSTVVEVLRLTESWIADGVTWNTRDGKTKWKTAGGSAADKIYASLEIPKTKVKFPKGEWYEFDITSLVKKWLKGSPNNGVMLKTPTTYGNFAFFNSKATYGITAPPKLVIVTK